MGWTTDDVEWDMSDTKYMNPQYVTYRLLETDGERGNYLRQVAKLLQPHPTAMMFAEQFEGLEPNDVLWRAAIKWPQKQASGMGFGHTNWTRGYTTCQVTVEKVVFDYMYGYKKSRTGSRQLTIGTTMKSYEQEKHLLSLSSISWGETDHSLGLYLPWYRWMSLGNKTSYEAVGVQSYDMLFWNKSDAIKYSSRMMALMSEFEFLPKLSELIQKVG